MGGDLISVGDIASPKFHQVTSPELALDRHTEQGDVPEKAGTFEGELESPLSSS